jgi:peroxiredoxin
MRNTRRHVSVRFFNMAIIATPLLAAAAYLFYVGVLAPKKAEEVVNAFRVRTGQPVPAITLADTLDARLSLASAVLGEPALVVVMNPTCSHCHTELASLRTLLSRRSAAERPRVVVVSVGETALLKEAARRYPEFPFYDDVAGALQTRLGLRMVPANFSVAADGRITEVRVGLQSEPYLASVLGTLANSRPSVPVKR